MGLVGLYVLFALLIPYIEIPKKPVKEPENIEIYLLTNGVHSDLVLPVKSAVFDWSKEIPFEITLSV